jgi:hypothetical protein
MKNIINTSTIRKALIKCLNEAEDSRHTTPDKVMEALDTAGNSITADNGMPITSGMIEEIIRAGWLNIPGKQEFKMAKGRYGSIREADLEEIEAQETTQAPIQETPKKQVKQEAPSKKISSKKISLKKEEIKKYLGQVSRAAHARQIRAANRAARQASSANSNDASQTAEQSAAQ